MSTPRPLPALITGASAGIGEAYARRLAERGHDLALVARRGDRLEQLAADLRARHSVRTLALPTDLQAPGSAAEIFHRIQAEGWHIGLLINNAGYGAWGGFTSLPVEELVGQVDLNVRAVVGLTRLFLPDMLARKHGAVVLLGSVASYVPIPYFATYAATKAFVLSFSEALAEELDGTGVHVQCVCPGRTATEFQQRSGRKAKAQDATGMSADEVVRIALADLDRGKRVTIPGGRNRLQTLIATLAPRRWVARKAKKMYSPGQSD